MGKLAIISDLHVDINRFEEDELYLLLEVLAENAVTHLHLAGDTANKVTRALEVVAFFQRAVSTTFHWGNHEMADLSEATIEAYPHPGFLNFTTAPLSEKTVLFGVNGWYDYQFSDLADEGEIRRLKHLYWYDRMIQRSASDPVISERINHQLQMNLAKIESDQEIILSTHFVPKQEFIVTQSGRYVRWNHLNAFLGSPDFGKVVDRFPNVAQVVFGHTHRRFEDRQIGQTLYSCRPFGYYFEWELTRAFAKSQNLTYHPMKLRGALRKHQPEFEAYKAAHLKAEFQRALTLISY